jgi:hypothetical protein
MRLKRSAASRDEAEALALSALAFLAEEPDRLVGFLSLTGLGPDALREALTTPELQAAVLGYLSADESLLLVFASTVGVPAERIGEAERLLGGGRAV